jgi:hypothetical protein
MRGRDFLDLAKELLAAGNRPYHWRAAIIHTYYALLLECRDTMTVWGLPPPTRFQVHAAIRLRLAYASNKDLKDIGKTLEGLGLNRNRANYDLRTVPMFATGVDAQKDIKRATDALTLLDAIDADPARRTAAIASIRP